MKLNEAYEFQLLGRMIADKSAYYENADVIHSDLFFSYNNIFEVYESLIKQAKHPTLAKMISETKESALIMDMVRGVDYTIPVSELVQELEESRMIRDIDNGMTRAGMTADSSEKIKILTETITGLIRSQGTQFVSGYEAAKKAIKGLEKGRKVDIPTGFCQWDMLTGGLNKSDLIILAAETSQGKTSLALNISDVAVRAGKKVAFISLEMTESQLMTRMICASAEVAFSEAKHHMREIMQAASDFSKLDFFIADVSNNSISYILGLIRSAVIRYQIDVVFVDYLQLIGDKSQKSREQEIGQIARTLKNIAKELNIAVVALSQLGRPRSGQTHYPTLNRLRDSGQIEEAADVVVFIYRPEFYGITQSEEGIDTNGMAEIIIAKGRNYGTGKFKCRFQAAITKFSDTDTSGGYGHNQKLSDSYDEAPF